MPQFPESLSIFEYKPPREVVLSVGAVAIPPEPESLLGSPHRGAPRRIPLPQIFSLDSPLHKVPCSHHAPTSHHRPHSLGHGCYCTGQHGPPILSSGQESLFVKRLRVRQWAQAGRLLRQLRRRGWHAGHQEEEGRIPCLRVQPVRGVL